MLVDDGRTIAESSIIIEHLDLHHAGAVRLLSDDRDAALEVRFMDQRGLLQPIRTAAGWRTYGPSEMARAAEIAVLRALGLSLSQVGRVLRGNSEGLEPALAAHQGALEDRIRQLVDTLEKVRCLRANLAQGKAPAFIELARLVQPANEISVAFDLPWPWGGERFELRDIRPMNYYIIGPVGSGKTPVPSRRTCLKPPS